jgi:hypothetical protein
MYLYGDKMAVDYEVGTNTAALPTVNALFHSKVSTHSLKATIDIVDYYLGVILPSPESVRIDVSSIPLLTLTKLGLPPFLRHSYGSFVLLLSSPNMATLKHPLPCSSATTLTPPSSPLS